MAWATSLEPVANLSISNTPTGLFQRIVLHLSISSRKTFLPSSAMSTPSQPSGMLLAGATFVLASAENASAISASGDITTFTPFSLALARMSSAVWN